MAAIRALYRWTSPTPWSCAATRAAGTPNTASTREMCSSKKSIIGHFVVCRTSRISSVAAVVKAIGVIGPSAARSSTSTTRRASSGVEMNGISRRSNRSCGNWMSSAFPIVSALMPVLSERKKTGVADAAGRDVGGDRVGGGHTSRPYAGSPARGSGPVPLGGSDLGHRIRRHGRGPPGVSSSTAG